ncbi:pro-interleukin-16-like isoform X2 [Dermochelys coriacea]|uniref:pro-interleukin-16-like isoform X2 n=1 Tax=Dermochelys coriacea TaxID=27794 RepID=UPI0018E86329|nr:pro-interleukin-16-like isoform X2 [Dermochelys coriacea]
MEPDAAQPPCPGPGPGQPRPGSWAATARPWRAGSCDGPRGPGPSPLFQVRPLQEASAQRALGFPCFSLQERIRLFQKSLAASEEPGPRAPGPGARGRAGQKPKPSGRDWPPHRSEGRVLSSRAPGLRPSSSGPPAQRELTEPAGETRPPPGGARGPRVGPGCSVREQVRSFELRFGATQAPWAVAAPRGRSGLMGAPAAGPQRSRAAWGREQESRPPRKGQLLSALPARLCLPQPEPPAPEQPQGGRKDSAALGLGALRAGARAPGLPQAPPDASRPKAAQGEGPAGEGLPRTRPAGGPLQSHLPRRGPLTSSPLPTEGRAPEPSPALPLAPWGLGESDGDNSDTTESSLTTPSEQNQPRSRSFALSLAELMEFGLDGKEEPLDKGRSTSLNSSLSMVSAVPAQDLEQMLEEVKGLGDESLQHLKEIQVVVLHEDEGAGLGFSISGGSDQHKRVRIHRVFASGLAAQEGTIQPGDEVLSINGHSLTGCSHGEAVRMLHRAWAARQAIVVLRKGAVDGLPNSSLPALVPQPPPSAPDATMRPVQVVKDANGLRFSLDGGRGSLQGDRPLTVKKIFQGGPKDLLQPGDELLQIGERSLQGLMRLEAWQLIRALPMGPVQLLVRKGGKP